MIATSNTTDVVIAIISASGVLLGVLIKLMFGQNVIRQESTRQHAENKESTAKEIGTIATKIDMVHASVTATRAELREDMRDLNKRLDKHIDNHFSDPLIEQRHLRAVESD